MQKRSNTTCSQCGFDNPVGMNFCGNCGSPLPLGCPRCGFANPPGFNFCGSCGADLKNPATDPAAFESGTDPGSGQTLSESAAPAYDGSTAAPGYGVQAERRQLTVMFCDLVESTVLSEHLDPEELRDVVRQYQESCTRIINRFDGYVAQFLGDGLLAYFGYPRAHEDDARRAVISALEILKAVDSQNELVFASTNRKLAVRIGIHTGLAVTGEVGSGETKEHLALGKTPNIAARLQGIAEPNTVVISEATHKLTKDFFDYQHLGQQQLKGFSESIDTYRVVAQSAHQSDMLTAPGMSAHSIIGRDSELNMLTDLWVHASKKEGRLALLRGEPGIGKSRVLQSFRDSLKGQEYECVVMRCKAYGETSTFSPIVDKLAGLVGLYAEKSVEDRIEALSTFLRERDLDVEEALPLFTALLGLPVPDAPKIAELTPRKRKQRLIELIIDVLTGGAKRKPLLLIVEDLHWIDPSTLELLDALVPNIPELKVFAIFTSRPSFQLHWKPQASCKLIELGALGQHDVEEVVQNITGGKRLPQVVLEQIVAKTDGVPLFVEELTKMLLESGMLELVDDAYILVDDLPSLTIPSSLRDSLTARLDSLGAAKEIAQLGASIGREFSYELLSAMLPRSHEALRQILDELVDAELLYQRGWPPKADYIFKHALVQDAAAASLLKTHRQELHRKIASVLVERYPDIARNRPERIAHHYTEAAEYESAMEWWIQAGKHALEQSASLETIEHARRGIELLAYLPDSVENRNRELALQMLLGPVLTATKGYASSEVEDTYKRAKALCKSIKNGPDTFPVLWGYYAFSVVRGDFIKSIQAANEMLELSESLDNDAMRLEANQAMGLINYFIGKPQVALDYINKGIALDKPDRDRSFTYKCGQDAGVCNLAFAGLAHWMSGSVKAAFEHSNRAIEKARELNHPYSLVYALNFAAWLGYMQGDPQLAGAYAREEIAISEEHGFFWAHRGKVLLGWAIAQSNRPADIARGRALIATGLTAYKEPGAKLSQTLRMAIDADVFLRQQKFSDGLRIIEEGLTAVDATGECFWHAELLRLKGELLLALNNPAAAETCFAEATAVARQQCAIGLERRVQRAFEPA